uniref:Uncharacterized protein n=1 Tax=Chlamydomonas leiostraca TaxID=1034604 RepID=A0A7S0WZJ3_9CHLO|mmetsp:Transcript_37625/g.95030  ORF Transcript_37625/g.95030 Transcript_37625/m.95030 type:complete len:801 (+) Transcript_37625:123-2525(+)|eukprot:CAMPEP_0202862864 /NCGR_PEP_ID=MMETSP1391-20130828/3741_1 /ASSEMBLY_ACC=CAM_ASM_000867 /TAXON_ID=1034604 /ORGANISM="Chlamydomonas leiostraca, Strain SAG 11-49" /LENGTH=800 /DNA_ID=CAMNT_0049542447 /DNA_START=104 /DNA_END=2506 /DNA_ORIENTATION=-
MSRMQDEDLYGGYDEGSNPLAGSTGTGLFQAVGAEGGMPPGTAAYPPGTAMKSYVAPGTAQRMGTAMQAAGDGGRPMTSNRGAGFSSVPNKKFDPLSQVRGGGGTGAQLLKKGDASADEQAKELEKKVHECLEASAAAAYTGDVAEGLEKAIEAKKRERALTKFREQSGLDVNPDLTYALDFNLAHLYHMNKNYKEALDQFTAILKARDAQTGKPKYPQAGRLRVNMGNIYFEQKKYSTAIKMYRMALDQIPQTAKEVRFKIMRNIGLSFVRMGQYQDSLQSFSTVMENVPDHQTGYNLVVCAFALGDREAMKQAFLQLITAGTQVDEDEDDEDLMGLMGGEEDDMQKVVQDDQLKDELRKRQSYITRCIVSAAGLISEKIDRQGGYAAGYDWCAEQLRTEGHARLANEVELAKASKFLANKEFEAAVAVFKEFEKKEPRVKARAATNLAFLYVLEGNRDQADKYSDLALTSDRYNARAFVNKGCVLVEKGDLEGARTLFNEAAGIEPYCVEAIFNLGLVNLKLGEAQAALAAFKKLHAMLPDNYDVIWQLANCYDILGDFKQAVKWLEMLSSLVPNDPGVLAKLGAIHARFDDESRALHYYQESHRVYPVNMDVISWLGAHHVKNEVYEKAMPFFDLASKIQPQEAKWSLMVASCLRRIGAYPQALARYKAINQQHPTNVECLRYLVHLCTELGRRDDAQKYMTELRKAERAAAAEATATVVGMPRPGSALGGMAGGPPPMQVPAQGSGMEPAFDANGMPLSPGLNVPVTRGKAVVAKEDRPGHDDWGNEELGDDLLPM